MNRFKKRVISYLLHEEWNIEYSAIPLIDFFSVRPHTHMKKAYRVKAHGHLKRKEQKALYEYGKQTGLHVIYIHETAGRELEFIRLYPRNTQKTEVI